MPNIDPVSAASPPRESNVITWGPFAAADTFTPYEMKAREGGMANIQAFGTFGGTVAMEVSNDKTNWNDLKDVSNAAIALTAAGQVEASTSARWIRPKPGAGVTATTVVACFRG